LLFAEAPMFCISSMSYGVSVATSCLAGIIGYLACLSPDAVGHPPLSCIVQSSSEGPSFFPRRGKLPPLSAEFSPPLFQWAERKERFHRAPWRPSVEVFVAFFCVSRFPFHCIFPFFAYEARRAWLFLGPRLVFLVVRVTLFFLQAVFLIAPVLPEHSLTPHKEM